MVGKPENSTNFAKTTDFNNILNDIINGKRQFNNLSKEENDVARRDRFLAAREMVSRIHGGTNKEESQDQRNESQEKHVEEWAKKEGVWHEDAIAFGKSFGEEIPGGQESKVYENVPKGIVIKLNYKGAGEFDIIEYHPIDNIKNERINNQERTEISGSLDKLSSGDEITEGEYPSGNYNVTD